MTLAGKGRREKERRRGKGRDGYWEGRKGREKGKLPIVTLQVEVFLTIRESLVLGSQNFTLIL